MLFYVVSWLDHFQTQQKFIKLQHFIIYYKRNLQDVKHGYNYISSFNKMSNLIDPAAQISHGGTVNPEAKQDIKLAHQVNNLLGNMNCIMESEKNQFILNYHPKKEQTKINNSKNHNSVKFLPNSKQFYQNPQPILHSRVKKNQQNQVRSKKIYEQNGAFANKEPNMLTFGPEDFQSKGDSKHYSVQKNQRMGQSRQIPQKQAKKVNDAQTISTIQLKIYYEKKTKPRLYDIMCRQVGMSQEKVAKLKKESLNYQLQKFIKKKGLQYLQENKLLAKKLQTQTDDKTIEANRIVIMKNIRNKTEGDQNKKNDSKDKSKSKIQKYPNYIPEVFPKINKRNSSKKTILSEGGVRNISNEKQKTGEDRTKALKGSEQVSSKNQQKKQIKGKILNDQEEMLGKIVYDKVQDYFKLDKQKADYFTKVKSEEQIDQAWIQYLRTKVNRANLMLNK